MQLQSQEHRKKGKKLSSSSQEQSSEQILTLKTLKVQRKIQSVQELLQHYKNGIGPINAIWLSKDQKMLASNIGTAFLIAQNLIATCTHNVYTNRIKSFAKIIQFVPYFNLRLNEKPSDSNIIKAQIIDKYSQKDLLGINFELEPVLEELTLLKLQKPVQLPQKSSFPILGNLERMGFDSRTDKLAIVGYPNTYFSSPRFRDNANIKLVVNEGSLLTQEKHILNYKINTSIGMSGSPVFAIKNKQVIVVGIHTHRGKSIPGRPRQKPLYNSGLYFMEEIITKIQLLHEQASIPKNLYEVKPKFKYKLKFYEKKQPEKDIRQPDFPQKSIDVRQKVAQPPQIKHTNPNQSFQNSSSLSVSYLQEESYQNTSQISNTQYEWMKVQSQFEALIKESALDESQNQQQNKKNEFVKQSGEQTTDQTETSFSEIF